MNNTIRFQDYKKFPTYIGGCAITQIKGYCYVDLNVKHRVNNIFNTN